MVTVTSVTPDATSAIMAENQFNDPPSQGSQFFMAALEATYNGAEASSTFDGSFRFKAVGPTNVSYSTFENSCGVIPDEISGAEVFQSGTISGNTCWQIQSSDAAGLVMFDDPFTFGDVERIYMSLVP